MDGRTTKQLIIALVFVVILAGIGTGIYFLFIRVAPTCSDGIKNGKEEGVDCGQLACGKPCPVPVQAIQVLTPQTLKVGEGDFDFVAQIYNPNTNYGSGTVEYQITSGGNVLYQGETYILPGQTKYIVVPAIKTQTDSLNLEIKSVQWGAIEIAKEPINFTVMSKNYSAPNVNGQVEGDIYNGSNYDFDNIDVAVILFDASDNIIGANRTIIKTFLAKTDRYFKVSWPGRIEGVARVEVQADTNLFNNSNYIRSHGGQEQFQTYY